MCCFEDPFTTPKHFYDLSLNLGMCCIVSHFISLADQGIFKGGWAIIELFAILHYAAQGCGEGRGGGAP